MLLRLRPRHAPFTAAACLVAVTGLIAARPYRANGVTFRYKIASASADARTREATSSLATVRMLDGDVRMDYLEGSAPGGGKASYILFQGKTGNIAMVSPPEKAVMLMTPEAFGSGTGAMMNNPMMKISYSNESFRYKDLGAGETILGYRTRRVRTYTSSTVTVKAMMVNQTTTTNDSSDYWFATGFDASLFRSFENWGNAFARGVKSTNPELAAEFAKFKGEYSRSGIALRSLTWSNRTDGKGKVTTDSIVMEVSELKIGPLDAALFTVPADYKVTDMSKMMADMKAGLDSMKADEAKETGARKGDDKAAGKDEKVDPKELLKQGLGGLLKRKKPPMP